MNLNQKQEKEQKLAAMFFIIAIFVVQFLNLFFYTVCTTLIPLCFCKESLLMIAINTASMHEEPYL